MRLKILVITLAGLLLAGWHLFLQCRSSGFTYRLLTLFLVPYWTTFVLLGAGVVGAVAARVGGRRGVGLAAVAVALGLIAIPPSPPRKSPRSVMCSFSRSRFLPSAPKSPKHFCLTNLPPPPQMLIAKIYCRR
ncbi:hypothetical protein AGMMS49959_08040 [Planctomycetales bacterium]|nr:hypothetical protein AGMMS49959_08040 [Planctomycetales bacterium]